MFRNAIHGRFWVAAMECDEVDIDIFVHMVETSTSSIEVTWSTPPTSVVALSRR